MTVQSKRGLNAYMEVIAEVDRSAYLPLIAELNMQ